VIQRRRVVVVQADGRPRWGVHAPLSVGVTRWGDAAHPAAIVLKATFDISGPEGERRLRLVEPRPLSPSIASELHDGLAYGSDFGFAKPRVDVLVFGHAHAAAPSTRIPVRLRVGDWERGAIAVAHDPTREIPLTPPHLESPAGGATEPWGVVREDAEGESYDARRRCRAAASMQLDALDLAAQIEIEGLSPRATRATFQLPGIGPRVAVDARGTTFGLLDVRCDTLHLDTDFEQLVLIWRAELPSSIPLHSIHRLVVSLEREGDPDADEAMLRGVVRGTVGFALEEDDFPGDADELEMARWEALEHAADPELPLDRYAAITAELAEKKRPRGEVLDSHGLDERSWLIEERAWTERIGKELSSGDGTPAAALGEQILAAQSRFAGPHEPRSLEEYARVKVALEGSETPEMVMAEHDIALGEWLRLDRHWQSACSADPGLARELRDQLAQHRRA
jgi:hypothetical protein